MLYTRVSSGLDFLDASIGGLYSNRCYLVRGPSQSGRTTLAMQFLLGGLENGESTMMISSDRIENVILKAEAMGLSIENYLVDNRLILMEYPKEITTAKFHYSHIINLLGEIEQYLEHYQCTRLVFDTLIPLMAKQEGTHLVNFIYSLINSLEELNATTLLTTGEPNSPTAQRITQLLEDAVVGSFGLSVDTNVKGISRTFSIHKMIDNIKPPTVFKVAIEYSQGLVIDSPKMKTAENMTDFSIKTRNLLDLPLHIAIFDDREELLNSIEETFHSDCQIAVFNEEEEFLFQAPDLDFDFVIINAHITKVNWNQILLMLKGQFSKIPVFVIVEKGHIKQINLSARKNGAEAVFTVPIVPEDIHGALKKALKTHGSLEDVISKRSATLATVEMPEDMDEFGLNSPDSQIAKVEQEDVQTPQEFREKLYRQVWRSRHQESNFSLISFKIIYTNAEHQSEHMQQGLELIKQISSIVQSSLRGLNDSTCRIMDKVVVILESSEKEGARAFANRISKELKNEIKSRLNLILGRDINILSAIVTYPEDGTVADQLMHQVTDVSRNFVKYVN